jgi:hypothetical protein
MRASEPVRQRGASPLDLLAGGTRPAPPGILFWDTHLRPRPETLAAPSTEEQDLTAAQGDALAAPRRHR